MSKKQKKTMENNRISASVNKETISVEEIPRRREEEALELRNRQREESFSNRHNLQRVSNGTTLASEEETISLLSIVFILYLCIHSCEFIA